MTPERGRRIFRILVGVLFLWIGLCIAIVWAVSTYRTREPELPRIAKVPDFRLRERDGSVIERRHLAGRVWIADFIFTHCGGACPLMAKQMRTLQSGLRHLENVRLVSFSVDPERDTPEALTAYATEQGALAGRWLFVTGERQALQDLARKGFLLGTSEGAGNGDDEILHSQSFALVDAEGVIRGYYDGTDEGRVARLASDAAALAGERQ